MGKSKIEFAINPVILDQLIEIQDKLPSKATRAHVKGGQGYSYERPAGLTLLGMKDDVVDTVVNLKMSGGCWDAPNINYDDMDKGLQALIKADRVCAGMALLRHRGYETGDKEYSATIPAHLKQQLHSMRNSFEDITKTAWIVLSNDYFRVYRPTKTEDGRVGAREVDIKSLFIEDKKTNNEILKIKHKVDDKRKKAKAERKAEKIRQREEYAKEQERLRLREIRYEEKRKQKLALVNDKLKDKKDSIIDAGDGFRFVKDQKGEYILCRI